jgi:hypothetical protein
MSVADVSQDRTNAFDDLHRRIEQVPSERDWALYQAVRVEQWPTRAAAEGFGISQTRVCQIVQRTAAFIAQAVTVPSKEDEARQLAAGKQLAADRIDYLYGQAMTCFRYSQGKENSCTTGRRSYGDTRYLHAAARLALIASTLPLPRQAWPGELPEEPASEPKTKTKSAARGNQPAETCSTPPVEQPVEPASEASAPTATAAAMLSCVEQSRDNPAPKTSASRPVQSPASGGGARSKITPRQATRRAEFFQTS